MEGEAATKWTTLIALAVALLVALGSGAALARAFDGANGPDDIAGTKKADKIVDGRAGNDSPMGDRGGNGIVGGSGDDRCSATPATTKSTWPTESRTRWIATIRQR